MNKQILQKGIDLANDLDNTKYRLVALITNKRGNIISMGCNSYEKTHPRQAFYAEKIGRRHQIFLHAEIDALIRCKKKAYAIYVIRLNNKDETVLAKPCKICTMAINDAGIEKIYHT